MKEPPCLIAFCTGTWSQSSGFCIFSSMANSSKNCRWFFISFQYPRDFSNRLEELDVEDPVDKVEVVLNVRSIYNYLANILRSRIVLEK
jgi:hypothetical protein